MPPPDLCNPDLPFTSKSQNQINNPQALSPGYRHSCAVSYLKFCPNPSSYILMHMNFHSSIFLAYTTHMIYTSSLLLTTGRLVYVY